LPSRLAHPQHAAFKLHAIQAQWYKQRQAGGAAVQGDASFSSVRCQGM